MTPDSVVMNTGHDGTVYYPVMSPDNERSFSDCAVDQPVTDYIKRIVNEIFGALKHVVNLHLFRVCIYTSTKYSRFYCNN